MAKKQAALAIPKDIILSKIFEIRGQKVMLDRDLAELYDVKAIRLREQVKRNLEKFPEHFMFQLTEKETDNMVSQNAIPSKQHLGGYLPYVFTEHGVLQLANVLTGTRATQMSIKIIEVFVKMREILLTHKDILAELETIKQKLGSNSNDIELIFNYLKQFEQAKQQELSNHLGNVHVVVSDRKLTVDDGVYDVNGNQISTTPDGIIDYFTADVLAATDYGPFGDILPGRSYNSNSYRYGWNKGSEMDNEITGVTGSHITTYFREYDTRLGRTWSIDPKGSKMPWQSPYTSMDNNPILGNDPMGDVWDKSNNSQGKADKFRNKTDKQINKVNREINSISKKMGGLDKSSAEYAALNSQSANLNEKLGELNNINSELNTMEKSDQIYQLKPIWQDPNVNTYTTEGGKFMEAGLGGKTYYKDGVVVMEYGLGDLNTQAHELKHGFQFETGLLSFNKKTGKGGWLYDLTDEQAAWKRGSAFGGSLTSPLLNVTTSDLIKKGYNGISTSLKSSMGVYDIFSTWGSAPSEFENLMNKTFKESGIDITR